MVHVTHILGLFGPESNELPVVYLAQVGVSSNLSRVPVLSVGGVVAALVR